MKILVTGASGLIGSALVSFLQVGHLEVFKLVRPKSSLKPDEIEWDPTQGLLHPEQLENFHAVIHLAGESISGYWTENKKKRILESRVKGTALLCQALSQLKKPPKVLVSASAVGYYGDRENARLTEDSPSGTGFLAHVCQEWEQATAKAKEKGIRVVHLRTGIVLSKQGGVLKQLLTPFKLCLGGKLGSGHQYMSWITLEDLIAVIYYALKQEDIHGPLNAVSINPVTNEEFTETLGEVLHRPTPFPVPATLIRLLFGEMGKELLLGSQRVKPEVLIESGFRFQHNTLKEALEYILKEK